MHKLIILLVSVLLTMGLVTTANAETKFGTSIPNGIEYSDSRYGKLEVARVFNTGAPAAWSSNKYPENRPLVVSFKYSPQEVIAGKHDAYMKSWFRSAPENVKIWWSYNHEPENNYITAAETKSYRQAWKHLSRIEHSVKKSNLKSTVILMSWRIRSGKGGFSNYYAGDKFIDVIAWDGYSRASLGEYLSPEFLFGPALKINKRHDKPFGIAEWGSGIVSKDYQGRADWIKDTGHYFAKRGAKFATYWDSKGPAGGLCDCRLLDQPSINAMRSLI